MTDEETAALRALHDEVTAARAAYDLAEDRRAGAVRLLRAAYGRGAVAQVAGLLDMNRVTVSKMHPGFTPPASDRVHEPGTSFTEQDAAKLLRLHGEVLAASERITAAIEARTAYMRELKATGPLGTVAAMARIVEMNPVTVSGIVNPGGAGSGRRTNRPT